MTKVYFATNRKKDGTGQFGYGGELVALGADQITYAVTDVSQIDLGQQDSGAIGNLTDLTPGNFSAAARQQIVDAGRNLLVFIHGASNSFEDAIKRAAYNHDWFAAAGDAAATTTVVAFTWPSAPISAGDIIGGYKRDQARASKSGPHIVAFLKNVFDLRTQLLAAHPQARVFLLAHSMGNHVLRMGIQSWFESHGPDELIFDQALHAAPDEDADAYAHEDAGLRTLTKLSDRISIYYSREDRLMWASTAANGNQRLGWNGPLQKLDTDLYPEAKFRFIDCTAVLDYSLLVPWDASHQYYRRSPAVRTDIVRTLVDNPRPDGGNDVLQAGIMGGQIQGAGV